MPQFFLSLLVLRKIFYTISALLLAFACSLPLNAAKAKAKKPDAAEILQKARQAFLNYEFEEAAELYEEYSEAKSKAKQPLDEEFEIWETRLNTASNAFDRVQKIVIVDSIPMPRASFFKALKLLPSAGSVNVASNLKIPDDLKSNELAFISEDKDYVVVPQPDSEGDLRLMESRKLLDGSWETSDFFQGDIDLVGDYAFPFMSGDGQTFYFANNGPDSMGGFDIFVAQKEPITGETRQPLNLGMPFNSPFDDFLMAVDEENGLGWWATDRNSPGGDVVVYVYLLDEIRKNYPSDTPDLADFAKITDYKATWTDADEPRVKEAIKKLNR